MTLEEANNEIARTTQRLAELKKLRQELIVEQCRKEGLSEFWTMCKVASAEVETWPDWMRASMRWEGRGR